VLLDAGRVTMLDEEALLDECRNAARNLMKRAGIREKNQQPTVNNQRKTEHAIRK